MDPSMNIGFEIVAWANAILALIALGGYVLRLAMCAKNHHLKRGQVLLAAYAISAFSIFIIFFLLVTGLYLRFAVNYLQFSISYIRPFFTFLLVTFIISTWSHPDFKAETIELRRILWQTFHRLIGKK